MSGGTKMKTYRITGTRYNETPKYYNWDTDKKFAYYTVDDKRDWVIDANDMNEAEKWFATNHPDYFMGGSINCITPNVHEFCMYAIPCREYGDGNYETINARIAFVRNRLVV